MRRIRRTPWKVQRLRHTTSEEVRGVIRSTKLKDATGKNQISNWLLKRLTKKVYTLRNPETEILPHEMERTIGLCDSESGKGKHLSPKLHNDKPCCLQLARPRGSSTEKMRNTPKNWKSCSIKKKNGERSQEFAVAAALSVEPACS